MDPVTPRTERPAGLERPAEGRFAGGVCAAIAGYFDLDVVVVRVGAVALALVGGVAVPLYLAAWLLIPDEATGESIAERLIAAAAPGPPRVPVAVVDRHVVTHAGEHDGAQAS